MKGINVVDFLPASRTDGAFYLCLQERDITKTAKEQRKEGLAFEFLTMILPRVRAHSSEKERPSEFLKSWALKDLGYSLYYQLFFSVEQ